jgi:hypothetical protein
MVALDLDTCLLLLNSEPTKTPHLVILVMAAFSFLEKHPVTSI